MPKHTMLVTNMNRKLQLAPVEPAPAADDRSAKTSQYRDNLTQTLSTLENLIDDEIPPSNLSRIPQASLAPNVE